jgi:hypothetical protein
LASDETLLGLRLSTGAASSSLTVEHADSSMMSAAIAAVSRVKRMFFLPGFKTIDPRNSVLMTQ